MWKNYIHMANHEDYPYVLYDAGRNTERIGGGKGPRNNNGSKK